MLNELPKKKKVRASAEPTRMQMFWRIQATCLRRSVTPCMMYLFTSLIGFALQAISPETTEIYEVVLGSLCIALGIFFNAHLAFHSGKLHYDFYISGDIIRRNRLFGIESGGDHRAEKEYRPWKGFLIGFYVGLPVVVFGTLAAIPATWTWAEIVLDMFAAWAILPVQWIRELSYPGAGEWAYPPVSGGYSLLFILLPVIVTGIFYIVGAMRERREKEEEAARGEAISSAGKRERK